MAAGNEKEKREVSFRDYWGVLVKRRSLILIVLLLILVPVGIYSLIKAPEYRGTALVLIEKVAPNVLSVQELVALDPSGTDFFQTQYQILESRALAREAIQRLNLSSHPEFKELADGGGAKNASVTEKNDNLIEVFQKHLKVEPVRNSRLVKINFEAKDPKLAAQAANALTQAYIDWNLGLRLQIQQNAALFLDEQVKEAKNRLAASEQVLQQYREKHGVTTAGPASRSENEGHGGQDISRQKLAQVNAQLVEATNRRIEAEIHYKKAQELLQNPEKSESISEVVNNAVIIAIKGQEVQLSREKAEKSEKFGPKHPAMVAISQEIENLKKRKLQEIRNIGEALKSRYEVALAQEKSLQAALGQSRSESIGRDRVAIQFQVLQQEVETNRALYDLLLKKLKETNVNEENRSVNIHVVDPAEVPNKPARPRVVLNLLLSSLLGLILGVGLAFFRENLSRSPPRS